MSDAVFHRELERDYPVASHARGVYIYDTAGKRYLDGAGSVFVSHIGHGVAEIEAAIGAQMRELAFAHTSYFASEAERRFADKLVAMAPRGFGKVWMSTSGAAANETAVKLARHYHRVNGEPERHLVIARRHSYHGSSLGALSLTGQLGAARAVRPVPAGRSAHRAAQLLSLSARPHVSRLRGRLRGRTGTRDRPRRTAKRLGVHR